MKRKKLIAALLLAAVLTSSGCGSKIESRYPLPRRDQDSSSVSEKPVFDFGDSPAGDGGGNAKEALSAPAGAVMPPRRVEELNAPAEDDESGRGTIRILITGDTVTDYLKAAEDFKSKGGSIKIEKTTRSGLYDTLAAAKKSGARIDVAQFDNGMMYPYGVAHDIIEPVDLAVRFWEKEWDGQRELSNGFAMNHWHYVLAFGTRAETVLYYDKNVISSYGLKDPKKLFDSGKWTTSEFCDMIRSWNAYGGECGVAGRSYEKGLLAGSGHTLVRLGEAAAGFSGNIYCPEINSVMGYIYSLKNDDVIGSTDAGSMDAALSSGTLFWSGSYADGQSSSISGLSAVPFPTLNEGEKCYAAEVDGLVLVKGAKNLRSVGDFLKCARDLDHKPGGKFAEVFCPEGKAIYEYGMGISPIISDSSSGKNEGFDKAVIPLMYTADPSVGAWDDICYHFSYILHPELTKLNNKIIDKIFGDNR